jgi:CheY-like chemotaxis protein
MDPQRSARCTANTLRPDPARPADAGHGRLPGDGSAEDQRGGRGYLPVLVLTAQPGHKLRALQAGARDFISKPFDLVEVKTRIHNMLEVRLLYRKLENYSRELERTVAGAHGRAARKRSALSQPDRAGLGLVLGAGRERQLHPGLRPGAGNARHPRRPLADGRRRCSRDRLERGGAREAAGKNCRAPALPRFRLQPRQWTARGSSSASAASRCSTSRAASSATAASASN